MRSKRGGIKPPYEDGINASQLDGHPASYFAPADHNHDDKYAVINHTHTQDQVDGLTGALNGKANTNHTHTVSQITDMPDLTNAVPSGVICMWSGESTAIPSGWHLCDGSSGTPDLRDRFIVGAGNTYKVKDTGGEASHKLTTNEMPSHNHTFTGTSHSHTGSLSSATAASAGNHTHTTSTSGSSNAYINSRYGSTDTHTSSEDNADDLNLESGVRRSCSRLKVYGSLGNVTINSGGAHTHNVSGSVTVNSATAGGTVGNTGGGQAHENRPPYFALCFIMKL